MKVIIFVQYPSNQSIFCDNYIIDENLCLKKWLEDAFG